MTEGTNPVSPKDATVLVVEDNVSNFVLIARMLGYMGIHCEWKTSGYEVAEYADTIQLANGTIDWMPGEYELPEWEETQQEMEVTFILFVNCQASATKKITIRKRAPNCADSQGRLSNIRNFRVSPSEAFEILQEVQVR